MYGKYRLDIPEERICRKFCLQVNRNQAGLPVVTVNDIRSEIDDRKHGKHCLVKENKLLNIVPVVAVGIEALKIFQIVDEIVGNSLILIFHDSHILLSHHRAASHLKMADILKFIPILRRDTGVIRKNYPDIPLISVKLLWQRADNVRQSPRLYERNTLTCGK